jgi:hypothetical protein
MEFDTLAQGRVRIPRLSVKHTAKRGCLDN